MVSHSNMILQVVLGKTYTFTMSNLPTSEQDVLGGIVFWHKALIADKRHHCAVTKMALVREIWFNMLLKPKGIPFKSHSLWSSLGPGTVSCPVMEDSVMNESPLGWLLTIKKTENSKCWQGCGEIGTLVHCCCWECKIMAVL